LKIAMVGQKGLPATYGGIERHVEEISARLAARGHDVTVFCRSHYSVMREEYYRGIRLVRYPSINTKHLDTASHVGLCSLDYLLRRYDVVHFHALGPSMFSYLPRLRRTRSLVTVHGLDWEREKWGKMAAWVLKRCEYPAAHFPSRTIVVSKTLHDYFADKYGVEPAVIPNGANLPALRPLDRIRKFGLTGERYVLFVGRLVPEKGVHYLAEAFAQLEGEIDPTVKLVLAGGTSFSDDYVQKLESYQSDRIRMVGYVYGEELEELWSNAYIAAQPSTLEGLSISLLEALSYGKCVLTSDIPENVEVTGTAAPSFKSRDVDDLREKLRHLIERPDVVREYERQGRDLVERDYSWDRIVVSLEELYDRTVGRTEERNGDGARVLPL
jgi:glycosyltransferase involved in cell wall biosynthesis